MENKMFEISRTELMTILDRKDVAKMAKEKGVTTYVIRKALKKANIPLAVKSGRGRKAMGIRIIEEGDKPTEGSNVVVEQTV